MQNKKEDLSERLLDFAADIIRVSMKLNGTSGVRHIANQVVRCATSTGANYQEACAAESRADFIHKMQIVLKELRESFYWLRLIEKTRSLPDNVLQPQLREVEELVKIFTKSVLTAKSPRK